jgi:hypothetical protein
MKFIIITGPPAVGKMTVGFEIAKQLDLKVFHNHMTIEPIIRLFDYGSQEAKYLMALFRKEIFKTMAESNEPGMIFTYVWDFDNPHELEYVTSVFNVFEEQGADCYLLELESDINKRLERNDTPLRLEEKPSKRNIKWSNQNVVDMDKHYRLNSLPHEIEFKNYLKINNTDLTPNEVSEAFVKHFNLTNI